MCLALNKSKKDAAFKHHGNTTNRTRHIKIHHPNQRKSIDPPKPNQSKIKIDEQKISLFTNETQQTKCSKKIDSLIIDLIVLDIQPFKVVEDFGFQALFKYVAPFYKISARSTYTNMVDDI